ncbi:MAG TPA: hypothetical protein VF003_19085 [Pseudonocardiaceae bacterium]
MPTDAPPAAQRGWRDAAGAPLVLFCWVEQVAESPEAGALFSRLHQRGQVVGLGAEMLYVRVAGESQLISVAPALVRVLDDTADSG